MPSLLVLPHNGPKRGRFAKKMRIEILTSEQDAKNPLAGDNIQHLCLKTSQLYIKTISKSADKYFFDKNPNSNKNDICEVGVVFLFYLYFFVIFFRVIVLVEIFFF